MKARILIDTVVPVKSGTILEIDEKTFAILKAKKRAELFVEKKDVKKKETATVEKETRKAKK